ncbi:MAG: hypothetical protein CFK52_02990 [Chloracidobacterium sp. CP2_5A]|nr:MAG: hypothetical protein CFK52_02990 [Chloracidobacterium sp. CP2_5A]
MDSQYPLYILAGGRSRRMGRPKATLPFPDRPLVALLAERFAPHFPTQRIVCSTAILTPDIEKALSDYCLIERALFDDQPDGGPLAGLERAARHAAELGAPRWLAIPCDMPFLTPAFLERLADPGNADLQPADAAPNPTAVVPCAADGRLSGVCAAYSVAIQPILTAFLESGRRRVQDFVALIGAARLPFSAYADLPQADRLLFNLNTPDDYQQALAWEQAAQA